VTTAPLYAEDLTTGVPLELGSHELGLSDLVDFAAQWDPQDFHTDVEAARRGQFGEVIASGLQTLAVFQRLSVTAALRHWAVIAGRQMREVRFLAPVTAGVLHAAMTVVAVEREREDRSLVEVHGTVRRADGTSVMTLVLECYVRNRPAVG
jgi:acyl dehydratase